MREDLPAVSSRYRIRRLLGEGGQGQVYLADDRLEGDRPVALKVLSSHSIASSTEIDRWRREFSTLRSLRHPGIARAFNFGQDLESDDGYSACGFFSMEYVEGTAWNSYMARVRKRSPESAAQIAVDLLLQVADALRYLHDRDVLHLDVKPENVLIGESPLDASPRSVLIDFGLVRELSASSTVAEGTAPFVAPEFFRGDAIGPSYDIYALGVSVYQAVSGRLPFQASSVAGYAKAHQTEQAKPLDQVPSLLSDCVQRMLAKDPKQRFQSGRELVTELLSWPQDVAPRVPAPVFHDPPFVGRTELREAFRSWLHTDSKRLFSVAGASGAGKTRALEQLCEDLELSGREALSIPLRCEGGQLAALLLEKGDILRPLAAGKTSDRIKIARAACGLSRPTSKERRRLAASQPADIQRLIVQGAADRCVSLVRDGIVLVLDDTNEADPIGRELLQELEVRLDKQPETSGGVLSSQRSGKNASYDLPPFDEQDALALELGSGLNRSDREENERQRIELCRETGGNPFLLIHGLRSVGHAESETGAVEDRIDGEVTQLEDGSARTLLALALAKRSVHPKELAAVLSISRDRLRDRLKELRLRGLIAGTLETWPTHAAVSTTVLQRSFQSAICDLHERWATHLEKKSNRPWEAVWHHLQRSAIGDGDARECEARKKAVRLLESLLPSLQVSPWIGDDQLIEVLRDCASFDTEESRAERFLEFAGDLLELRGCFSECLEIRQELCSNLKPDESSARRWRKLGAVEHRTGDLESSKLHLNQAIQDARAIAHDEELLRALAELALLSHYAGDAEAALQAAGEGLERWRKLSSKSQVALAHPAVDLCAIEGQIHLRAFRPDLAIESLKAGCDLTERHLASPGAGNLLNNLGLAYHMGEKLQQALQVFERAEASAREASDAAALTSVLCNRALILAKTGRYSDSVRAIAEASDLSSRSSSPRFKLGLKYTKTLVDHLCGFAEAAAWSAVEELAQEAKDPFLLSFSQLYRAECLMDQLQLGEALSVLEQSAPPSILTPALHVRLAHARGKAGLDSDFDRVLADYRDSCRDGSPLLHGWNLLHLTQAALQDDRLQIAEELANEARQVFKGAGYRLGELEATLESASIRASSGKLGRSRQLLRSAEQTAFEGPDGHDCRNAAARIDTIEALLSAVDASENADDASLSKFSERSKKLSTNTRIRESASLRWAADRIRCISAILEGRIDDARPLAFELRSTNRMSKGGPASRRAPSRDAWRREWSHGLPKSLARLTPPVGTSRLPANIQTALLTHTEELAEGATVDNVLSELRENLGAECIECALGSDKERKSVKVGVASKNSRRVQAAIRLNTSRLGTLRLDYPNDACPGTWVLTAARLAAAVLAPHLGTMVHDDVAHSASERQATRALERTRTLEVATRRLSRGGFDFVAASKPMHNLLSAAAKLAVSDLPILIEGESGVGKDLLARWVHEASGRADAPFVTQNCAAIPEELLESDLFGHRQGAFSGAETHRTGFIFRADGGTFLLEEIAALPLSAQGSLLNVLENRSVRPLGSNESRSVDVRFIASSQHDLRELVKSGKFREDLYFRLSGATLRVPPLRDRLDDIDPLCQHIWSTTNSMAKLSEESLKALAAHHWPGNVRELGAVLQRLALTVESDVLTSDDIAQAIGTPSERRLFSPSLFEKHAFAELSVELEIAYLKHLYATHKGDMQLVARELGTTLRSAYRRLERLEIKATDLR